MAIHVLTVYEIMSSDGSFRCGDGGVLSKGGLAANFCAVQRWGGLHCSVVFLLARSDFPGSYKMGYVGRGSPYGLAMKALFTD